MTEAQHEDLLTVISSVPERVGDLLAGVGELGLRYRHGPAFPTLQELVSHLTESSTAIDSVLRQILLNPDAEMSVRAAIDPPMSDPPERACSELLDDYAMVRRRTMDVLRGFSESDWDRTVIDSQTGGATLLAICEQVMAHEVGHLSQARNLVALLPASGDLRPIPGPNGSLESII